MIPREPAGAISSLARQRNPASQRGATSATRRTECHRRLTKSGSRARRRSAPKGTNSPARSHANLPRPRPAPPPDPPAAARTRRSPRPSTGCANASRAACRNCRSSPNCPAVPYWGSPHTGWPIAARCTRIWWVRPVSSVDPQQRRGRQQALDLEVGPRLARLVGVDRHQRAVAPVSARSGRRSSRSAPAGGPSTSARYSRRKLPRARSAPSAPVDLVVLGHDQQPRGVAVEPMHDPGAPRLLAAGAHARRAPAPACPSSGPRAGCTTTPAGLSTTSRYSSS